MSDPFPPQPPQPQPPQPTPWDAQQQGYAVPLAYQTPMPQAKPTSVMVIGVIGIILGAFGVLCTPFAVVPLFVKAAAANNPAVAAMQANAFTVGWSIVSAIINTLLAVLLLAGSIGSVMLKRWARGAMIKYAVAVIIMTVLAMIFSVVFIFPALMHAMNSAGSGNSSNANATALGGAIGGIVGGVIGLLFALALPTCILIFYRKPHVVAAFEAGGGVPSYGGPSMPYPPG